MLTLLGRACRAAMEAASTWVRGLVGCAGRAERIPHAHVCVVRACLGVTSRVKSVFPTHHTAVANDDSNDTW